MVADKEENLTVTRTEITGRMDELAREYARVPPGTVRREEIVKELVELCSLLAAVDGVKH
jgi:hypothetical protein